MSTAQEWQKSTDSKGPAAERERGRLPPRTVPGARPEYADEQLTERLGIKITSWDPDRLVGTMPVKANRQEYGLLHTGASAALASTLGGIAAAMRAGPDRMALGLELSCINHRTVFEGYITGVCTAVHAGNNVATYEVLVTDSRNRRICTARFTCVLRERTGNDPSTM
ncbi:hotdog fold thioesterase [Pendulispora brunnea]|uniref:Hotdog fold thioesterase n=1 Tax=Pendulispora brunnea TaxID=2905690 RepID=A0ABZ2KFU2_9BACT